MIICIMTIEMYLSVQVKNFILDNKKYSVDICLYCKQEKYDDLTD